MSHTFQVAELPIVDRLPSMKGWLKHREVQSRVEGRTLHWSGEATVGGPSPFFHALGFAFNLHHPLAITPDAVWLTCLTGLVHHIDTDPERLREQFVMHQGKQNLVVFVESSVEEMTAGEWEDGIADFAKQLRLNTQPKREALLVNNFSTTTSNDRLASQVAMMGALKHFFEYKMIKLCGFTRVTVEGTPGDWASVIERVRALSEFGLEWWTSQLLPVLGEIKSACEGRPDIDFWKRAYLEHRMGSGGEYSVSGWINAFFPYVAGDRQGTMQRNPFINWESNNKRGLDPDYYPSGLVSAPVTFYYKTSVSKLKFYGGLVGVSKAQDNTLRPVSGYAIQLL